MPDEPREFARSFEWNRERIFPELGVAVRVERAGSDAPGVIFVRELRQSELFKKPKRLTRRPKKA